MGSGFLCGAHCLSSKLIHGFWVGMWHIFVLVCLADNCCLGFSWNQKSIGIKHELLLLGLSVTLSIFWSAQCHPPWLTRYSERKTGDSSEVEMHCLYLLNLLSCKSFLHFWISELTEVMACGEEGQHLTTASLCALLHIKIYWSIRLVAVLAHKPVPTCTVSFPEIILCFLRQRLRQFGLKNSEWNYFSVLVL